MRVRRIPARGGGGRKVIVYCFCRRRALGAAPGCSTVPSSSRTVNAIAAGQGAGGGMRRCGPRSNQESPCGVAAGDPVAGAVI